MIAAFFFSLVFFKTTLFGCLFAPAAAVHSEHEAGASLSGGRSAGRSSGSEQTHRGVGQEEADHKGISHNALTVPQCLGLAFNEALLRPSF